ncbi:MAG: hypothetical protein NTX66_00630 [Candidatus Falkowbacteria bacterium]|nr:hypothetical protein [Candidatus Falkowbacteria bacterium]
MLDLKYIRSNLAEVKSGLLKRIPATDFDLEKLLGLDDERKTIIQKVEVLKAERNKNSKTKPTPTIIKKMKSLGQEITRLEDRLNALEIDLQEKLAQ